jgi:DNA invertase Pin-like site-specific DNA recombinase|tara:strand:+ start:3801 stop:4406 length:606 start_codon:yes stop_codon:yes gene_type:complete
MGQKAVIYARVSTSDQSCERQIGELTSFAERGDFEIVEVFKETASGTKSNRAARNQIMDLAQARRIDAVLVTELSRWGRSTQDLLQTLEQLAGWNVSIVAMSGMTFELSTPHGRMMATMLAGIAQFERDLLSERVKSGLAAAKARGKKLGRQKGQRPKADRVAPKVLELIEQGRSYRWIARDLAISKNTVGEIIKRHRQNP